MMPYSYTDNNRMTSDNHRRTSTSSSSGALEEFLGDILRDLIDYPTDIEIVGDNARLPVLPDNEKSPRKALKLPLQISRWETSGTKTDFIVNQVSMDISPCSSRWDRMTNAVKPTSSLAIPERKEDFDKFTLSKSPNYMRRSKRNLFMRSNSLPKGLQALPYS